MIKLVGLSDEQVKEISRRIADAFFDYEYNKEDIGLIKYITTRDDMFTYMNAIVRAAYKSGVLYTTSDRQEGYLMLSGEGNEHVPVWNHDITLVSLDDDHTQYTDRVEIHAGWKTLFIWLWANMFYAHRQRKWIRLLQER